jgi:CubicO group peptidase (beta-lactamase class C family)
MIASPATLHLLLALALPQVAAPADSLASERVAGAHGARLDTALARYAQYGFWGSVLVVRDGRIVLLKGYGLADATRGIRNTPATRFEMNSITKTFTGAAILQLAAAGRLSPADAVERHLGAFPPGKRGATVEQLATHTSGLIREGSDLAGDSREAFVLSVKHTPREAPPGAAYRYSNAGFSLLAAIVEVTGGERYEDYVRRHLFAPAGMHTAFFRPELRPDDTLSAHGYMGSPAGLLPGPPNPYVWGTIGAGGIWATVGDMYRWLAAIEGGRILREEERRLVFTPRPSEAYGWHVATNTAGRLQIDKGGGSDDFASQLLYYPRERVTIIWASNNLRQRWRRTLNASLQAIVFDDGDFPFPPPVADVPDSVLASYAGRYVAGGDTLELRTAPGYLYTLDNRLGIPADALFCPNTDAGFTGFDPQSGAMTHLRFDAARDGQVEIRLADGRRITAAR